jgi:hypothetical protein
MACGQRVTVDRSRRHHHDGHWCGPVDTEHSFSTAPDEPYGHSWIALHDPVG